MKFRISRTIFFFLALASAGAGLYSCSGEKEVSSYPIADLTPRKHGCNVQRHFGKKRELSHDMFQVNSASGFRQTPVSFAVNKTNVAFPYADESKYDRLRQHRSENLPVDNNNDELFAGLDIKPEGCTKKVSHYIADIPVIIIPADDTIKEGNNGATDETLKKKDPKDMNGFGIVSLVTGILSLIMFPFLAPVAIVFGAIGLNKRQKGMAIAGFVMGIVTIVIYALFIILLVTAFS